EPGDVHSKRDGGDGDAAGVLGAAEHDGGGGGDHAGGAGDGAGCTGEHGDRVYGERHSSDRDEPGHWDARGDAHARRGRRGGNVRQPVDRQGGDGLHADGDGRRKRDERGVQHHGGDGDAAGVLRAAQYNAGGRGDHAGGAGDGAGRAGEHGDRVYGERHDGDRDEPEHRDPGGDEERGGRRRGRDVLRAQHR